jgi:ATP-dependent RNA helicase DeaD
VLTEEPAPEDLAMASALLDGRTPERIAAALASLYRARLPAPEELAEPKAPPTRSKPPRQENAVAARPPRPERVPAPERAPRPPRREGSGGKLWFSVNVGRQKKADPKWLIPLICRLGAVEKRDIGSIVVLPTETRFEIVQEMAEDFLAALPDDNAEIRISRATPPPAGLRDGPAPRARKIFKRKQS